MEFFAVNGKRPKRLQEETRLFAYESLNHKYGRQTMQMPCVDLDDIEDFKSLSEIGKYDAAIKRICETAPIRIVNGEKISGAATLAEAAMHRVPARYGGEPIFSSVSHLTVDFETVLKRGVDFIKDESEQALEKYRGTEKEEFFQSCIHCLDCMATWHRRYLDALDPDGDNYRNLKQVPFQPARNFYEAVQSIWFTFAFLRLCGNWPGIGRIDWLLGEYLENDLKNGVLTREEAREILAHFFIKGCEWIAGGNYISGDAQHYQNILLGGVDEHGNEVTNTVTYLVLDVLEELGISDFPTTVRVNKNTDPVLLKRVAEVIRLGGGVIAVYNEQLIIDSLVEYGYELTEARKFANDGCWEIQIPGKTFFTYCPFDSLAVLQKVLKDYSGEAVFENFEELYRAYIQQLRVQLNEILDYINSAFEAEKGPWVWKKTTPCTVVSLFEQGCIEKGCSYLEGGPVYNVISPHIGGLPDTVNSLYAIKKLIFDDKKVSFMELMQILKNDWQGNETLRQYAMNHYSYYGNDNDEVDLIAKRLVDDFAAIAGECEKRSGFRMPAGISTFGRQIEWAVHRLATANGKQAGAVLSGNFSPLPGTDKVGATAIIRSYCKSNLKRTVSGAALDIKLLPSAVNGENGMEAIISLLKGFVLLGGHFMQLDIADTLLLKEAQKHPEDYQTLSVRVSGWNARFVTMCKEWQDMIIAQTGSEF